MRTAFCQLRPPPDSLPPAGTPGTLTAMRRGVVAVVAVGILGAACTVSSVNPKANVEIDGTVLRQGGARLAGARVALLREGDVGDVLLTIASIGVACIEGKNAPAICHNARITTTGSAGSFGYTLKGRET